ncbi:hypothetical protein [Thalassotalea maritima]|uniref:hypothetical protein n=1 Tax=Thalassotalea maritima TaxID=3242416 RepID=UPI00352834F6
MKYLINSVLLALSVVTFAAFAAPEVAISQVVEKDIEVEVGGEVQVQRVVATEIEPGETLYFTLTYSNSGDEKAVNVAIDSPVPNGTQYVLGSATGENAQFFIKRTGQQEYLPAQTQNSTEAGGSIEGLRWIVDDIEPGKTGSVSFNVTVNS